MCDDVSSASVPVNRSCHLQPWWTHNTPEPPAQNKLFLLKVALVLVFYCSDGTLTNVSCFTLVSSKWSQCGFSTIEVGFGMKLWREFDKFSRLNDVPVSREVEFDGFLFYLYIFYFLSFFGIGKCSPWIPWSVIYSKTLNSTTFPIQWFIICLVLFRKRIFPNGANDGFKMCSW